MLQVNHIISADRSKLTLFIDPEDREELRTLMEESIEGGSAPEYEALDHMIGNSELDWVFPSETGDLTDAHLLGIRDEEGEVIERWGYAPSAVKCFLKEMLDGEQVSFTNQW